MTSAIELELWAGIELEALEVAITQFEKRSGHTIKVRHFDTEHIRSELLLAHNAQFYQPDLIWVPSDFVGLKDEIDLADVSHSIVNKDQLEPQALPYVTVEDKQFAVPLTLGSHLVLYRNKSEVDNTKQVRWEDVFHTQAKSGQVQVAMQYPNMYFLAAFASLFTDENQMKSFSENANVWNDVFDFYYQVQSFNAPHQNCDSLCAQNKFTTGQAPYLIDGIWAYPKLKQVLGSDLQVVDLPSFQGVPMTSFSGAKSVAIMKDASADPVKSEVMLAFLSYIQSEEFLNHATEKYRFITVNKKFNGKLLYSGDEMFIQSYLQFQDTRSMPGSYEMAIFWEAVGRVNRRHASGMPTEHTGEFLKNFMNKHLDRLREVR